MTPPPQWVRYAGPVVAVVITVASLLEASGAPGGLHRRDHLLAFGTGACLLVSIGLPLTGLITGQLLILVPYVVSGEANFGGAALIADVLFVAHVAYRRSLWPALAGYLVAAALPSTTIVLSGENPWEFIFFPLILGPGFLVGLLLRREQSRSAQLAALARELAAERELRAHSAVVEERARISQELHDAVAHTMSVMTLQAGVVRRRLAGHGLAGTPELAALVSIEQLGRQSVDELRRVVGLLRDDDAVQLTPRASLNDLESLAAQTTAAGTTVQVRVSGQPRTLAPALDISAFRIIQESLSNTMRHGGARAAAVVTIAWSPSALDLQITDDGTPPPTTTTRDGAGLGGGAGSPVHGAGGHGLVGMRERTEMFGGHFAAGPRPGGGFAVHAVLPLTGEPVRSPLPEAQPGDVREEAV